MHNQNINHGLYHQGEFSYNYGSAYYNNYTNWSGGKSGGKGGTTTNHNKPIKIINNLEGKARCVYDKLQNISGGFRNMIQKFDGDFPVSHLTFKINNNLRSGNYGRTNPPNNYNITIEMSNVQLRKISDLGAAVSFAHEVIHAEIGRKILSIANTNGAIDKYKFHRMLQKGDFPGILDYYRRYGKLKDKNGKRVSWQHEQMAAHYIRIMADIVQSFDNNRYNRQVYEDISWAGLRVRKDKKPTDAWKSLNSWEKSRIKSNLKRYFHHGTKNCH